MKYLKDVRVQIGIALAFLALAFVDQRMTGATDLNGLSIIGKVALIPAMAFLAWIVIRVFIIGMIFKK